MDPSTIGLGENLIWAFKSQFLDVTKYYNLNEKLLGDPLLLIAFVAVPLVAAITYAIAGWRYGSFDRVEKRLATVVAIYILLGWSIVIAARTKYEWGSFISVRNASQYTIYLLSLMFAGIAHSKLGSRTWANRTLWTLLVGLICLRFGLFSKELDDPKTALRLTADDPTAIQAMKELPLDSRLVANSPSIPLLLDRDMRIAYPNSGGSPRDYSRELRLFADLEKTRKAFFLMHGNPHDVDFDALEKRGITMVSRFERPYFSIYEIQERTRP
ncbi:MAG: hypothetical protein QM811_06275 [Pirellulales bacterium]